MDKIHLLSIVLEVLVLIVALMIGWGKRRPYGKGLAITFAIYVYYDLARLYSWPVSQDVLYLLFLIASASALWSVWRLYKRA